MGWGRDAVLGGEAGGGGGQVLKESERVRSEIYFGLLVFLRCGVIAWLAAGRDMLCRRRTWKEAEY